LFVLDAIGILLLFSKISLLMEGSRRDLSIDACERVATDAKLVNRFFDDTVGDLVLKLKTFISSVSSYFKQ